MGNIKAKGLLDHEKKTSQRVHRVCYHLPIWCGMTYFNAMGLVYFEKLLREYSWLFYHLIGC